jgi:hypothetical protein
MNNVDNFVIPHQSKLYVVNSPWKNPIEWAKRKERRNGLLILPVSTALITIKGFKF